MSAQSSGVGVLFRATDHTDLPGLAKAAEERGFDALVLGEHTHIPVATDPTENPGGGAEIPQSYARLLDPYIALTYVAATTSLKIGTFTSLPAQHDPIALAKALATLDHLSEGRLTLGVGYGWGSRELLNHGHEFKHRRAIVRESVELMRQLWENEVAEYQGEHVSLAPSWSWPKPQRGSIPVLLGILGGPVGLQAVVDWGDGWLAGGPAPWIVERVTGLRQQWADAGRPEAGPVIWATQSIETDEQVKQSLDDLRTLGVEQILVGFDSTEPDEVLPVLDRYAALIR